MSAFLEFLGDTDYSINTQTANQNVGQLFLVYQLTVPLLGKKISHEGSCMTGCRDRAHWRRRAVKELAIPASVENFPG